jgi:hypothetical protein
MIVCTLTLLHSRGTNDEGWQPVSLLRWEIHIRCFHIALANPIIRAEFRQEDVRCTGYYLELDPIAQLSFRLEDGRGKLQHC